MARLDKKSPLNEMRGTIGKELVFKKYSYGTVVSKYPDMSGIKKSKLQKLKQGLFAKAVAYAKDILRNPAKKATYQKKLKKGQSVYHAAIKEYIQKNRG